MLNHFLVNIEPFIVNIEPFYS